MSPFQLSHLLIKNILILLVLSPMSLRASIYDVIDNLGETIGELEAQAQYKMPITPAEQTTSPLPFYPENFDGGGVVIAEDPLLVGSGQYQAQAKPESSDVYVVTGNQRNPQPFTILMNFQNDGTTSMQILQGSTYWTDQGRCRHGQIYDPITGVCRDVFCAQGFVLRPQGYIN